MTTQTDEFDHPEEPKNEKKPVAHIKDTQNSISHPFRLPSSKISDDEIKKALENSGVQEDEENVDPEIVYSEDVEEFNIPSDVLEAITKGVTEQIEREFQKRESLGKDDYTPLENAAKEYLKCFIIIGYGLNGEKVYMGHANNQAEHDALIEHLRKTFQGFMSRM